MVVVSLWHTVAQSGTGDLGDVVGIQLAPEKGVLGLWTSSNPLASPAGLLSYQHRTVY